MKGVPVPFQTHEASEGSPRSISFDRHRTFAALQCGFPRGVVSCRQGFSQGDVCSGDMFRKETRCSTAQVSQQHPTRVVIEIFFSTQTVGTFLIIPM